MAVEDMDNEEMVMTTIKKVYAIREASEKRAMERLSTPLLGYVRVALGGTGLTRDQQKDVAAFVTASCNTGEKLTVMEKISEFKTRAGVQKPGKVWLSYAGLLLPMALAVVIEAILFATGHMHGTPVISVAILLVIVALALGIFLYSFFGYDHEYRREALEHEVWRAVHRECLRRIRHGGVHSQRQLPPSIAEKPITPLAPDARAPAGRRKL